MPRNRARKSATTTGPAKAKKAEFTPAEIAAARKRLTEEIQTANIQSRRSRLAQAAGLGSVGGLGAAPGTASAAPAATAKTGGASVASGATAPATAAGAGSTAPR